MVLKLACLAIGLVIANYLYQFITEWDWRKAFERSWFQGTALVGAGVMLSI